MCLRVGGHDTLFFLKNSEGRGSFHINSGAPTRVLMRACKGLLRAQRSASRPRLIPTVAHLSAPSALIDVQVLEESGFHVLDVTEIGVGVLCTCSGSKNVPRPAGTTMYLPQPAAVSSDSLAAEAEAHSMNHYGDR